jgi:hypothetical protein
MLILCTCILYLLYASCISSIMHSNAYLSQIQLIIYLFILDGCPSILVEPCFPVHCYYTQLCTIGHYSTPSSQAPHLVIPHFQPLDPLVLSFHYCFL